MRTQSTFSPQSWFLTASTALARADSFSSGATESSRSKKTMSAGRPGALPSIFSLEAGTERQDRRGRFRVRADIRECYESVTASGQLRPEERDGALPGLRRRVGVVHFGPSVVEEGVVGAGVDEHLHVLAQVAELLLERPHRVGRRH